MNRTCKRSIRLALSLALMLLFHLSAVAAECVIGSTENTTQYLPLAPAKEYVYSEIIYDAESLSSISTGSTIQKIGFQGATTEAGAVEEFDLYIANSSLSQAPSEHSDLSAMQHVYSGALTLDKFDGMGTVFEVAFDEEFTYSGGSLHLVAIAKMVTGTCYFSYQKVANSVNFGYAEDQLYGSSYGSYRPVINVSYEGSVVVPTTHTVVVGTADGYNCSWYGAPITSTSKKSMSETVYTADELGMGGQKQLITNLAYKGFCTAVDNGEQFNITVWMGNCKAGKYDGTSLEPTPTEPMKQVYNGTVTIAKDGNYGSYVDILNLDLGEGFAYAGGNLKVVVKCETTTTKRIYWAYDESMPNSSIYEDIAGDGELQGACKAYANGMPVTKFEYEAYEGEAEPYIDAVEFDREPSFVIYTDKPIDSMLGMIFYTRPSSIIEGNTGGVIVDWGDGDLKDYPHSGTLSVNSDVKGHVIKVYRSDPDIPIEEFYCFSAEVTDVEIYEEHLTLVDLHNNKLSAVDLSKCPDIERLNLSQNKFFEFEYNSDKLKDLKISRNELEQIRISGCSNLRSLDVSINLLRSHAWIELPSSKDLVYLDVSYNMLSEFDLSKYPALQTYICNHNRMESIDLRFNTELKELKAFYQGLTSISTRTCPQLETLDVSGTMITDLDLRQNKEIKDLNVSMTQMTDISLSKATKLEKLNISGCAFESLDVSANTVLKHLECANNAISDLDLANNVALEYLDCSNNGIASLDITALADLMTLKCSNNKLSSLDTELNTMLGYLDISTNNFSTYDPSVNPSLYYLNCANNALTELSVADMVDIVGINASANRMEKAALEDLFFSLPDINGLFIDEEDLSWKGVLNFNGNPGAKEADTEFMKAKGWKHNFVQDMLGDAAAMIVVPQELVNTRFIFSIQTGDAEFDVDWGDGKRVTYQTETYEGSFTNPEGVVAGTNIKIYAPETTLLALANCGVSAVLVDNMPCLQVLSCSSNKISEISLVNNPEIVELQCGKNPLTIIELPADNKLEKLYCDDTLIKQLDLSNMKCLKELDLDNNNLTTLDLSHSTELIYLSVYDNDLESINLSACKNLQEVYLSKNALTELDLSGNKRLSVASFTDNAIKRFDASTLTVLQYLYVTNNGMQELVLDNEHLVELVAGGNEFESIDLSTCESLGVAEFSKCKLSTIDVSKNIRLDWLFVGDNRLETITFGDNQGELNLLHAENNKLTSIDFSSIPSVSELIVSGNMLSGEIDLSACNLLNYLDMSYNSISSIKFASSVPNLQSLYVRNNELKTLSVPSGSLGILDATRNQLAALNISECNLVMALLLAFNNLNSLNLEGKKELLGLSIRQNKFGKNTLNNIYEQLPDINGIVPQSQYSSWMCQLNISGNPGAEESNTSVARMKGWTVNYNEELPELRDLTITVTGVNGEAVEGATFTLLLDGYEFEITPTSQEAGIYKFIDFEVFTSYDYVFRVSHPDYEPVETGVIDFTGDSVEVAVSFTSVGVEDVEAIEAVVYGANGCIVIKTEAPAMITVYDMMGGIVSRHETEGDIRIEDLQRGIYIVRINDKTQKVLVK